MPRRRRVGKSRYLNARDLNNSQYWDLVLGDDGSFASEKERREVWFQVRADLMRGGNPGTRPAAWWAYESPERRKPDGSCTLRLYRLGLLEGEELAAVEKTWARALETAEGLRQMFNEWGQTERAEREYRRHAAMYGVPGERQNPPVLDGRADD